MKKVVWTVAVDNYFPELLQYTLPNLEAYAKKIGAEFRVIRDRKYPEFPPTYEKLQIHELGHGVDWNILIDADTMLHPDTPDFTQMLSPDHLGSYMQFQADLLFEADQYFMRDGRRIGIATNIVVTHLLIHDVWQPLEFGWETAKTKTKREFIIDEYCVSRNVARFGIKTSGLMSAEDAALWLNHFDLTTELPDRAAVVEKAKKLTELWSNHANP